MADSRVDEFGRSEGLDLAVSLVCSGVMACSHRKHLHSLANEVLLRKAAAFRWVGGLSMTENISVDQCTLFTYCCDKPISDGPVGPTANCAAA